LRKYVSLGILFADAAGLSSCSTSAMRVCVLSNDAAKPNRNNRMTGRMKAIRNVDGSRPIWMTSVPTSAIRRVR
jgi:hypothetical protein